uniref:Uncharacterized protein n=1 Tax=Anguilla anguilla TaxID=7936 RepID=A0A0E9PVE2_ANGAN
MKLLTLVGYLILEWPNLYCVPHTCSH